MPNNLIHIGFSNYVEGNRIISMCNPNSAPIRRAIKECMAIDHTNGRKIKTVIFMDNNSIVLSALTPETIAGRVKGESNE